MAVFTIADLHLSNSTDKSMEVFGARWLNYTEKLISRWSAVVSDDDTVIIPGDISWAMTLNEATKDFAMLNSLPGHKIIGKGNHDFWWATLSKINAFLAQNNFDSIKILHNNAYVVENIIVCGTRGWFYDEKQQVTAGENVDFEKIVKRETLRLRFSLEEAAKLRKESGADLPIVAFFHFPPVWADFVCRETVDLLHEYGVRYCYYGHIHGNYFVPHKTVCENISMSLVSADFVDFTPVPVFENKILQSL